MPKIETVENFISIVESNEHDKAIEEFYTLGASMKENQSEPRVGRDNLLENERKVLSKVRTMESKCIHPVFIKDDHVVIRWYFKFEWKDGTTTEIEEIAHQHWEGEYIREERFFYDPKQLIPK
ncbi:MAG: polyketide cyclase [Flavobacteriaceae bacterium]|nr:MAG: polyketide cyclase [Flavobacteriaceae bacterium]